MMDPARLTHDKGLTLVEITIAIAILVIAILGSVSVAVTVIKGNAFSKTLTTATTLAKDRMEQLKNTSYASLASGTDYAAIDATVHETRASDSVYTRTWTVNSNSPASDMTTIDVNVEWSWEGSVRNVTLRTIVAR